MMTTLPMFHQRWTRKVEPIERIKHVVPETQQERQERLDAEYVEKCRIREKWTEHNVNDDDYEYEPYRDTRDGRCL